MYCRHCGMESRTADRCEFCKRPFAAGQAATAASLAGQQPLAPQSAAPIGQPLNSGATAQPAAPLNAPGPQAGAYAPAGRPAPPAMALDGLPAMQPQPTIAMPAPYGGLAVAGTIRTTLTGEVIVDAPPALTGAPVGVGPQTGPPISGSAPASAVMPGLPLNAYSPKAIEEVMRAANAVSPGERWEQFLAIGMPLLALSLLTVHLAPASFVWITLADVFLLGLAMGATGAIPSYDDAFADCTTMLIVCLLLGPVIAGVVYLVVCLVKQEFNTAILALLAMNVVVRLLLAVAFASSVDTVQMFLVVGFFNVVGFVAALLSFGGWILSSFLRPVGE